MLAPLSITKAALILKGAPPKVRVGDSLFLRLAFAVRHAAQCAEELDDSLGRLSEATHVEEILELCGAASQPLHTTLVTDATKRCMLVSIMISSLSAAFNSVTVCAVSVAGQPVAGGHTQQLHAMAYQPHASCRMILVAIARRPAYHRRGACTAPLETALRCSCLMCGWDSAAWYPCCRPWSDRTYLEVCLCRRYVTLTFSGRLRSHLPSR